MVHSDWETFPVILGLFVFGVGQVSLVTLLFNMLVTASPKKLAGDVGSLRGTTNNLAAAVGTAVAGALVVGLLSAGIMRTLVENPRLPPEIQSQIDLDSINFVSNDRLLGIMQRTTATPEQVDEAMRINTEARLRALKISLLTMAGLALLAIFPAGRRTTSRGKSRSRTKFPSRPSRIGRDFWDPEAYYDQTAPAHLVARRHDYDGSERVWGDCAEVWRR